MAWDDKSDNPHGIKDPQLLAEWRAASKQNKQTDFVFRIAIALFVIGYGIIFYNMWDGELNPNCIKTKAVNGFLPGRIPIPHTYHKCIEYRK